MGGDQPKQFINLNGLPIILHTINAFYQYSQDLQLVLVLPNDHISRWDEIKEKYQVKSNVKVCSGGDTRTASVRNGLAVIGSEGLVAIHDAVRPLITPDVIGASFESARDYGSGIAAVALKDSIRQVISENGSHSVDREQYRLVQTPQTFSLKAIKAAYQVFPSEDFSDDATVFEKAGNSVCLVNGSYNNFKITTEEDLVLARLLLEKA